MDAKAGKGKGEHMFPTYLDIIKSICKPGIRQTPQLLISVYTKKDWKRQVHDGSHL